MVRNFLFSKGRKQKNFFKGIIHVHSTFSYDGKHSIEEIARYGRQRGYRFIGMSEHSDTLDQEKVAEHVKECQRASTTDCLIIPGIEFTCEQNVHIVGLGVEHYTDTKDPVKVTGFIQQQRGIAIIAHPSRYNYKISPELTSCADGIEAWNQAYDGRFVPNDRSLKMIKDIKRRKGVNNGLPLAFGGSDLHSIGENFTVEIGIFCDDFGKDSLMKTLKMGAFRTLNPYFQLDARQGDNWQSSLLIYISRRFYCLGKEIRDLLQRKF